MITSKDFFGKEHIILRCVPEDIDTHFKKIEKVVITDTEESLFKERMLACITAGSAYKLSNDSCFLYYLNSTPRIAEGIALFGQGNPAKMIALFKGVTEELDPRTVKITFYMHKGKFIEEYKSILTPTSIKRQVIEGYPLVVRVDEVITKIRNLYKRMNLV